MMKYTMEVWESGKVYLFDRSSETLGWVLCRIKPEECRLVGERCTINFDTFEGLKANHPWVLDCFVLIEALVCRGVI